jgi:hypothetical protein
METTSAAVSYSRRKDTEPRAVPPRAGHPIYHLASRLARRIFLVAQQMGHPTIAADFIA